MESLPWDERRNGVDNGPQSSKDLSLGQDVLCLVRFQVGSRYGGIQAHESCPGTCSGVDIQTR